MDPSGLIIPLGVTSYLFILLAILTGTRVIKMGLKYHKAFALMGAIGAAIHLAIAIYLNYL